MYQHLFKLLNIWALKRSGIKDQPKLSLQKKKRIIYNFLQETLPKAGISPFLSCQPLIVELLIILDGGNGTTKFTPQITHACNPMCEWIKSHSQVTRAYMHKYIRLRTWYMCWYKEELYALAFFASRSEFALCTNPARPREQLCSLRSMFCFCCYDPNSSASMGSELFELHVLSQPLLAHIKNRQCICM